MTGLPTEHSDRVQKNACSLRPLCMSIVDVYCCCMPQTLCMSALPSSPCRHVQCCLTSLM